MGLMGAEGWDKGCGDSLAATVLTQELAGNEEESEAHGGKGEGNCPGVSGSNGPLLTFVHSSGVWSASKDQTHIKS